jgi:hypothetical protein
MLLVILFSGLFPEYLRSKTVKYGAIFAWHSPQDQLETLARLRLRGGEVWERLVQGFVELGEAVQAGLEMELPFLS